VVAPNIWRETHQRLFIFLPKIVNMWSMETTNKGHLIKKPNKWYQMIPKGHLSLIDYFWLFLPMIVNFYWVFDCLWFAFDDCFWLSFDFFYDYFDWVLIVFYDCFWLSFWLSMMIVFESYECLWWLILMIVFEGYVDYW